MKQEISPLCPLLFAEDTCCWGRDFFPAQAGSVQCSTHPNTANLNFCPGNSVGVPEPLLQGKCMLVSFPYFLPGLGLQQLFCMSESPYPARCLSFPTWRSRITELTQNWKRKSLKQGVPQLILTDQKTQQANTTSKGCRRDLLLTASALDLAERGCRTVSAY